MNIQEIEAKFYVLHLDKITTRLHELKARLIQPRVFESNIRFDLPNSELRSEGRVLRLRQDTEARLTYKDSSHSAQGVVSRREIEFVVDDFEKAKLFLEALGYQKLLVYEKYRATYDLNGCHIMLDELPYGDFVEIEGESLETIHAIAKELNLNLNAAVTASYAGLLERLKEAFSLAFTDLTFDNFKGLDVAMERICIQPADG